MNLDPEEIQFWVKLLLIIIFGVWGLYIGGRVITANPKAGKNWPGRLPMVATAASIIVVVAAVIMFVIKYHWPVSFDFVLVAALSLFIPTMICMILRAEEGKKTTD